MNAHTTEDLTNLMKQEMGEGHTVVLDDLGRFKISIVSDTVANPSEFNILTSKEVKPDKILNE